MQTPPTAESGSRQSSFDFAESLPKLTSGEAGYDGKATGRLERRTVIFLVVLAVIFAAACSVAFFYSEKSNAFSPEACARSCAPRTGVLEREGFSAGPQWRPTPHNIVCICR